MNVREHNVSKFVEYWPAIKSKLRLYKEVKINKTVVKSSSSSKNISDKDISLIFESISSDKNFVVKDLSVQDIEKIDCGVEHLSSSLYKGEHKDYICMLLEKYCKQGEEVDYLEVIKKLRINSTTK